MPPLGPAGRYRIGYRVVAPDGHPVTGTIDFTLTRAVAARPSAAPPTGTGAGAAAPGAGGSGGDAESGGGTGDGLPLWVLLAGAFTAIALGGAVAALRRGRRSQA